MKLKSALPLCLLYLIIACAPAPSLETAQTPSPPPMGSTGPTPTVTTAPPLPTATASQPPTATAPPSPTAAPEYARWKAYQEALSTAFLPADGTDGDGVCEWELLGRVKREVYVWAMCQTAGDPEGAAVSAPAVLNLDERGNIRCVDMPRDGALYGPDVRELFPGQVQQVIFNREVDTQKMWVHIQKRHQTPQPPLIVQLKTPLP